MDINLVFAGVVLAAMTAGFVLLQRSMRRSTRRLVKGFHTSGARQAEAVGNLLWPQIESLLALYRVVDGLPTIPPTRRWAMSPDLLLHIARHVMKHRPETIVECGGGCSTAVLAHLLRALGCGHLFTLENNPEIAEQIRFDLRERGLEEYVSVIVAPLTERSYPNVEGVFLWYAIDPTQMPALIDLLIVDGPWGGVSKNARYPAGPELLPRLAPCGHAFVDDAGRSDEGSLDKLWRHLYPDLGIRKLNGEKGALELFFLDHKVSQFISSASERVAERDAAPAPAG